MLTSETIRLTVLTAAPVYMSLTAFRTVAGAAGRSGSTAWPLDGEGWYMMTSDMGRGSAGDSSSLVASLGAGYSRRGFGDTSRTMTDEISGSVASAGAGATPDPAPDPAPPDPARPKPAPRDRAAARLQRWEIVARSEE